MNRADDTLQDVGEQLEPRRPPASVGAPGLPADEPGLLPGGADYAGGPIEPANVVAARTIREGRR